MNLRTRTIVPALVLTLVAAACGGDGAGDRPLIVATTTVLGDVAAAVAGDDAVVETLMPVGADPHDFEPSSRQAALLEEADLVIAIGLELEHGLEDLLESVEAEGVRVLEVGPLTEPDWLGNSLVLDPHIWMDPLRMALAAELIAAELTDLGLEGPWADNAASARATYEALDAELRATLDVIPAERRLLVTAHESLGYFAGQYGFEIIGAVVEGGSSLGNPSSASLADLIDRIGERGIPAVFGEVGEPSALLDAIAAEPGLDVIVVSLFVGSLGGEGSGAESYVEMMRTNSRLIVEALTR
jgi:zinc/manganese transport system substrate-binding protein